MATHSSVLAWRIPGTGSLVGYRLWGRRVGHDWSDLTAAISLAPWGLYLCHSSQNLQAVGQGMVHNWSFTNICWMNKHIGHRTLWHVVISGGQQSRDSRCHGRIHEVPFHTLWVIPHCFKGSFPYDPTLPSVEQPPFLLECEQVLYQEQTIFSFNIHRDYWGKFISLKLFYFSFLLLCLFVVSFVGTKQNIFDCYLNHFNPTQ